MWGTRTLRQTPETVRRDWERSERPDSLVWREEAPEGEISFTPVCQRRDRPGGRGLGAGLALTAQLALPRAQGQETGIRLNLGRAFSYLENGCGAASSSSNQRIASGMPSLSIAS